METEVLRTEMSASLSIALVSSACQVEGTRPQLGTLTGEETQPSPRHAVPTRNKGSYGGKGGLRAIPTHRNLFVQVWFLLPCGCSKA